MNCPHCRGPLVPAARGVHLCPECLRRGRDGEKITRSLVASLAAKCLELEARLAEAARDTKERAA